MDSDSSAQQELIAHVYEIDNDSPPEPEMDQSLVQQFPSMVGHIDLSPSDPGQTAPVGELPPRVETSAWEEYRTLYMTVVHDATAVARRLDNNFINGTKLLNVTGISRGRRDGILKQERVRHVVRMGTQNLKGVWIPFERAYALGKLNNVCDRLYPLFLADLTPFLYEGNYKTRTQQEVQRARLRHPEFGEWIDGVPRPFLHKAQPHHQQMAPQRYQIQSQDQLMEHQQQPRLTQYHHQHHQLPQGFQPLQRPLVQSTSQISPRASLAQPQQMMKMPRGPAPQLGAHRRQGSHRRTYSKDTTTPYERPRPLSQYQPQGGPQGHPQGHQHTEQAAPQYIMPLQNMPVEEEGEYRTQQQHYYNWRPTHQPRSSSYIAQQHYPQPARPKIEEAEYEQSEHRESDTDYRGEYQQ